MWYIQKLFIFLSDNYNLLTYFKVCAKNLGQCDMLSHIKILMQLEGIPIKNTLSCYTTLNLDIAILQYIYCFIIQSFNDVYKIPYYMFTIFLHLHISSNLDFLLKYKVYNKLNIA